MEHTEKDEEMKEMSSEEKISVLGCHLGWKDVECELQHPESTQNFTFL